MRCLFPAIVLLATLLHATGLTAQVIDTVCPGDRNVRYFVDEHAGADYQWQISGGTITAGNGTHQVFVDWGGTPGIGTVSVTESNMLHCQNPPVIGYVLINATKAQINYPPIACYGDTATITVSNAQQIVWDNQSTQASKFIQITTDTSGWVIATSQGCGQSRDTLHYMVKLGRKPVMEFGPDTGIYHKNQSITIQYGGNAYDQVNWEIKKFNIFGMNQHSFLLLLSDTGKTDIKLYAISKDGCPDSTMKTILVTDESLYVPNAFTPNNDGLNDIFKPVFNGMTKINLSIMNRWGDIIFESTDKEQGWDALYKGQPVQADSYTYLIEAFGVSGKYYVKRGSVDVIR